MSKLTKVQTKLHDQACQLLEKDELTLDEKFFVYENWHEGADHNNGKAGAFFTPVDLAGDFRFEITGPKVIDICAGIGVLSFMYYHCKYHHERTPDITCVEINPTYVEVGRKLFPEANWICADVCDVWDGLDRFDTAIANPPFGRNKIVAKAPCYTGADAEYKIIDIASNIADYGAFIIPQNSAPFRYSGRQCYERHNAGKFAKFYDQTGIDMDVGIGVDTTCYQDDWRGVSPLCEIVTCEFTENINFNSPAIEEDIQLSLF